MFRDTTTCIYVCVFHGIVIHVSIHRASFVVERHIFTTIISTFLISSSHFLWLLVAGDQKRFGALDQFALIWLSLGTGFLASLSLYRLLFHRCQAFPGPSVAKLTRLYAAYLNAKNGKPDQYYVALAKLHRQYGDYLRIGRCSF